MANKEHFRKLQEGVMIWNAWRAENPSVVPDLARINLNPERLKETPLWNGEMGMVDLRGIQLEGADLSLAHMTGACLAEVNLKRADLRGAHLVDLDLKGANLQRATLASSYLERVNLREAKIEGAILTEARIELTDLEQADLRGVNLVQAHLFRVDLYAAWLTDSLLFRAHLRSTNLDRAHLERSDMREVRSEKLKLTASRLSGVQLRASDLRGSLLREAHMEKADLQGVRLERADLRGAHLTGAILRGANLRGADLRGTDLRDTNVAGIRFDRWAKYHGIRLEGCHNSPRFIRLSRDQEFIEELRHDALHIRFWIIYIPWLITSDCGRSLLLWTAWSLFFALGFGFQYWSMGPDHFDSVRLEFSLHTMIYYSIVTFTTLGFGDVVPKTNTAAWWITGEVIVGYVMLGGLISIFSNKLARRG